jgi:hypothetical protein
MKNDTAIHISHMQLKDLFNREPSPLIAKDILKHGIDKLDTTEQLCLFQDGETYNANLTEEQNRRSKLTAAKQAKYEGTVVFSAIYKNMLYTKYVWNLHTKEKRTFLPSGFPIRYNTMTYKYVPNPRGATYEKRTYVDGTLFSSAVYPDDRRMLLHRALTEQAEDFSKAFYAIETTQAHTVYFRARKNIAPTVIEKISTILSRHDIELKPHSEVPNTWYITV